MRRVLRRFYNFSVTSQIFLVIICLILPINIVSMAFAYHTRKVFIQQSADSAFHTANLYMNALDERIYAADIYLAEDTDSNTKIFSLRNHVEGTDYKKSSDFYWQELYDRTRSYMEADAYFFYIENEDYVDVAVKQSFNSSRQQLKQYVKDHAVVNRNTKWFYETIGNEHWLIHMMKLGNFHYGAMIQLDSIAQNIDENLITEGTVTIDGQSGMAPEPGKIVVNVDSERSGVSAHILLDRIAIEENIPMIHQIGAILVFIYILCTPVLLFIINRIFIRPMNALNHAMDELESGNPDYRMPENGGNRETSALNRKYNSMADNLKNLRIQVYEKELEKRDIEATNLRLQVNPHFILNCLNIIFSMAKSERLPEIKRFTKYLAGYFRFSLWHTSGEVSLGEELTCVENYIEIQKMRFPGAFTYLENVDDALKSVKIPSLLILNFIENSVKYGLQMGSEIEIIVIVRKEEEDLILSVCDTGCGMDEETLRILRSGDILCNESGRHIGLWNCRRRLALKYGDKAYMNITSSPGGGTQIFVRLPVIKKGDEAVK